MILDGEGRLVGAAQAFVDAVEQGDVRHLGVRGQRLGNDAEPVVLRSDLDLAGRQVLDRLVGTTVAALHLAGLAAQRERQHLMSEADAEQRHPLVEHGLDGGGGIDCRRRRIPRPVGEEHTVGLVPQDVLGCGGCRHDRDLAAGTGEATQDVALGAVIDRNDMILGLGELAVAFAQLPCGLVPIVGLLGRDLEGQIHAVEPRPVQRNPAHPRWADRRRGCAA